MNIHFFTPPPAQRAGGLEAAIRNLREALVTSGVTVDGALPEILDGHHLAHFHGLWQPAHATLARACRQRGIAYVVSPHGMLEPWAWRHKWWKKWPYFQLVERANLRRAALLLATSELEAARIRQMLPGAGVVCVPLGMTSEIGPDYDRARTALGWKTGERVLLFLSRLHLKKGLDLLLRALAETDIPARENSRLVIVGGGDPGYVGKLRALARELGARLPRVEWAGEVWGEDRWKYFQGADLFCLPTHSENFGLAVLEACQVGTPVLTTTGTPWKDWLGGGRGYIADPTVPSLKAALSQFVRSPAAEIPDRTRLAAWTRENFSWKNLAPRYLAAYRAALDAPRKLSRSS